MSDQQTDQRAEQREGGVLFKVRNKTHPKGPDWRGDVTKDGVRYGIAAWERTSEKTGNVWLSVKLEEYREKSSDDGQARSYGGQRGQTSSDQQTRRGKRDGMDDPMPF